MKSYWCECNRCDGGKVVGKTTWYSHNRSRTRVPRKRSLCPRRSTSPPRESPPLDVESGPTGVDVNESWGDPGSHDAEDQAHPSDFVGVIRLSYLSISINRVLHRSTSTRTKESRGVGLPYKRPDPLLLALSLPPFGLPPLPPVPNPLPVVPPLLLLQIPT